MILPGKHIRADRSLIVVGGEILEELAQPRTVSELWDAIRVRRGARNDVAPITYDWFVLALSFLYAISALRLDGERLVVERAR